MSFFTKSRGDEPVEMIRTHHPFLHPTKGWRSFARPGKANRRRKLIAQGSNLVPGSRANLIRHRRWNKCLHQAWDHIASHKWLHPNG